MPNRDDFPMIFDRLKKMMQPLAPPFTVQVDQPDNYSLNAPGSTRYPKGFFFGAVQLRKNYVSYHLMPVYMFPELLEGLSERLRKRMQGKSCFNFTAFDEEMFTELAQLTTKGIERFRSYY